VQSEHKISKKVKKKKGKREKGKREKEEKEGKNYLEASAVRAEDHPAAAAVVFAAGKRGGKKRERITLKPVQSEQKIIPQQRQWCLRRKKPKGL
jgi:hypothetical protein